MPSRDIKDLHPELQTIFTESFNEFIKQYPDKPKPFLTCTFRSNEEQNALYAQGRSVGKLGSIVTNARAGQSPHNFKPTLAGDVAFAKTNKVLDWSPKLFMDLYAIMQKKFPDKVTFGGNFKFKDYPHYELKNWKSL